MIVFCIVIHLVDLFLISCILKSEDLIIYKQVDQDHIAPRELAKMTIYILLSSAKEYNQGHLIVPVPYFFLS